MAGSWGGYPQLSQSLADGWVWSDVEKQGHGWWGGTLPLVRKLGHCRIVVWAWRVSVANFHFVAAHICGTLKKVALREILLQLCGLAWLYWPSLGDDSVAVGSALPSDRCRYLLTFGVIQGSFIELWEFLETAIFRILQLEVLCC